MDCKNRKVALKICFALYALLMLWLLFFHNRSGIWERPGGYWQRLGAQYNLAPFHMTARYLRVIFHAGKYPGYIVRDAVRNLGGNIGMLIPLGFFLPALFPKLRRLGKTLLAVACIIILVELLQLFTLTGHCDIDDLILNLMGGALGYGAFRVSAQKEGG